MRVLMVDNYESFTYNLVHLLEALSAEVVVRRSDEISLEEARALDPERLVVSPGPGRPSGAGRSLERGRCSTGKASVLRHDGRGVFAGLPAEIEAGRYHSLAASRVPDELEVTARTADGEVMGVRHRAHPIEGVQFRPESVLTPHSPQLLENFLRREVESKPEVTDVRGR
jgi:anthranilate/para-aminobenzoate synthase component II